MDRPLTEPRDYEALCAVFRKRGSPDGLLPRHALDALVSVRAGKFPPEEHRQARDFLGGNGLISRFGIKDSLTSAGWALLGSTGRL